MDRMCKSHVFGKHLFNRYGKRLRCQSSGQMRSKLLLLLLIFFIKMAQVMVWC